MNARGDAVPGSAASGLGTEYDYVTTSDGLTLTGHLAWHRWSAFPRPTVNAVTGNPPQPALDFHDTAVPRASVEYARPALGGTVAARAGYAFLWSPAPDQTRRETLYDNDRHQLAAGVGLAWPGAAVPLHLDAWVQLHHLAYRRYQRDPDVVAPDRAHSTAGGAAWGSPQRGHAGPKASTVVAHGPHSGAGGSTRASHAAH